MLFVLLPVAFQATLRMQMAKTVVLAAAIGDVFTKALDRFLRAPVESVTPPNLRKVRRSVCCMLSGRGWG